MGKIPNSNLLHFSAGTIASDDRRKFVLPSFSLFRLHQFKHETNKFQKLTLHNFKYDGEKFKPQNINELETWKTYDLKY